MINFLKKFFKRNNLEFSDKKLFINKNKVIFDYPIKEVFQINNKIIIFFEPDSYTSKFGQFNNIIALDIQGNKLWEAELPTNESSDRYYKIKTKSPLITYSIKSFECEIDINTGKIKRKTFYK